MLPDEQQPASENIEQTTEPVVDSDLQPIDTGLVITIPTKEEEKNEEPVTPKPTVYTCSGKFYAHEKEYIDKVLKSRQTIVAKGKPLTRDMNHFIRQCVRFTLNHSNGMRFFIPDDIAVTTIDT